jgi:bacteriorhodopsin
VGDPLVFNLRTSQVGQYFWGVLALLALALVILVARRIRQRLREQRTGP